MQHIAESCRGRVAKHIGTDERRMASYGSTIDHNPSISEYTGAQDQYDTIEAEIDQLKEDVALLRMEADQGRTDPKTEHDHIVDKFLSTRSKPSTRCKGTKSDETTAVRLQRLHETRHSHESASTLVEQASPALPSPLDFPVLASSSCDSAVGTPNHADAFQRKLSYANVATNGMMEAIDRDYAPERKQRSNSKVSTSISNAQLSANGGASRSTISQVQTGSTSVTLDSHESREDDVSVIVRSTYASDAEISKGTKYDLPSDNKKKTKQSPHFAQPTKSFARRTGEILRRDAASLSPKSPADGSPGKTIRGRDSHLATVQRAAPQQQKRKPLPGDWLNSAESRTEATTVELTTKSGNILNHGSTSTSKTVKSNLPVATAKTKVHASDARSKDVAQNSPMRKKTSSYMAPTNATKQRSVATHAEHKAKAESPGSKVTEKSVEALDAAQPTALPPRPQTALSDNSSVQFILEADIQRSPTPRTNLPHKEDSPAYHLENGPSPRMAKSPPVGTLRSMSPRSPTRGPKAQLQVRSPTRKQSSHANTNASGTLSSLPMVANTITKRRTSHSNVLTAIVARLESEGILNKAPQNNGVIQAYLQRDLVDGNALRAAQEASPRTASQRPPVSSQITSTAFEGIFTKAVMPPHLRPKQTEARAAKLATDIAMSPDNSTDTPKRWCMRSGMIKNSPMTSDVGITPKDRLQKTGFASSRTLSLRADAAEFKPSMPLQSGYTTTSRHRSLGYIQPEQWEMLPFETRVDNMNDRAKSQDQAYLSNALQSQVLPPYAAANASAVAALNNMVAQRGLVNGTSSFVDENGSPNTININQMPHPMLKPCINPRKKTVQWMLQDHNGPDELAHFGRAAVPTIPSIYEPSTPTISSTSDDTSPVKTPNSLHSWHIGSAISRSPYGWTGGDGKEIRFVGYGPHAERYPDSVVNFNFQGRTSSFGATTLPNRFNEDKENFATEYVAPKSQRQWAEKLGYYKQPCGDVEITRAVEHLPFGSELAKYCHDCAAR